jgi:hypothetical protein
MALTEPAQFTTEKLKQAYRAVVFIDCDDESKYWSNELLASFNGHSYENELSGISAIRAKVDIDGGFATIGNLTIDLINLQNYSDWLQSNNVDGKECKFYLVFNDGTALTFSESVQFFTGLIDDVEIGYDKLSISISHKDMFFEDLVGELIDEDEYTNQLSESIGKMKPIVYGNHYYNGPKANAQWEPNELPNMIPCVQVSNDKFVVSNHAMGYLTTDDFWLYHNGTGRYFHVNSAFLTLENVDANGDCVVTTKNGPYLEVYDFWHPYDVQEIPPSGGGYWSNVDNAIDKDLSTVAALSAYSGNAQLIFNFNEYDYNDYVRLLNVSYFSAYSYTGGTWRLREGNISYGTATSYIEDATHSGGTVTVTTRYFHQLNVNDVVNITGVNGMDELNGVRIATAVNSGTEFEVSLTTAQTYTNGGTVVRNALPLLTMPETTYGTPTNLGDARVVAHDVIGKQLSIDQTTGSSTVMNMRCIYKRVELGVGFGSDFIMCAAGNGKKDGSNYIENPVDIIDDVIDSYTSLSSSDFDSTAFTAAQTARASWDFDFVLTDQQYARELMRSLCKASNLYGFWNNENKIKLVAYKQGADASYTANIDEFSEIPGAAAGVFAKNRIREGSLSQRQVNINDIANKINIDYALDQVAGHYQSRKTCNNSTSQAIYGTFEKSFVNPYVFDAATAQLYVDNMIDILAYKLWVIRMTAGLSAFNVEVGDVIDIDNFIDNDIKWVTLAVAHKPLDGTGWIDIEAVEQKDTSGDSISTTTTSWGIDGEQISGGIGGGSFGIGGSGGGEIVHFYGEGDYSNVRGIVHRDQYGQPIYQYYLNANDAKNPKRIVRKESYDKPV